MTRIQVPEPWILKQAELCVGLRELRTKYAVATDVQSVNADAIIGALDQFQECVRYSSYAAFRRLSRVES